jgi:tetratricopeptide (TPR) repeat protein
VSDLFSEDQKAEAEGLKALTATEGEGHGDGLAEKPAGEGAEEQPLPDEDRSQVDTAAPRPPAALVRRKWLLWGVAGLLAAVALFLWVRWHIPGLGTAKPLEAFEARRFGEAASGSDAGGPSKADVAERYATPDPSPLEQQARSLMATDPPQAQNLWEQVIAKRPDNLRAHFNLGLLYLERQAYAQAVAAFERVLALAPDMIDARFNLAFAYAKMGRHAAAAALYRQVVDEAPEYLDEVLFNLAIVQDFQGDQQGAARSLQAAIRFNPHNVRAISYLARMEGRFSTPKK